MLGRAQIIAGAAVVVAASWLVLAVVLVPFARGQQSAVPDPLVTQGHVSVEGREVAYTIRHLPVSSYPELPAAVAAELETRGCLIPQTYEAHRPENVIHGSLERAGTTDWAVLCSVGGRVQLLVFFASGAAASPAVLAEHMEIDRLQSRNSGEADAAGVMGFNWGIDPASPAVVHQAQLAMAHRPATPDHDSVADSVIDHRTVYHLFRNGAWERLTVD